MGLESFSWMQRCIIERFSTRGENHTSYSVTSFTVARLVTWSTSKTDVVTMSLVSKHGSSCSKVSPFF